MARDNKLPRWSAKTIITHDDLNALSDGIGYIRRDATDNLNTRGGFNLQKIYPYYFIGIVQENGGSPGLTYDDGQRCYVKVGRPKESLQYQQVFDATKETIPGIAGMITATNLANRRTKGPMPPAGEQVVVFDFTTAGTNKRKSRDHYVFWWQGQPGTLRITGIISGAGAKYNAVMLAAPTIDVSGSGDAVSSNLGFAGTTTVLLIDANEIGRAAHSHLNYVGQDVEAVFLRVNADGTSVYRCNAAPIDGETFEVSVAYNAGSDGSGTAAASWTYDVTALNGESLGTAVAPLMQRPIGKTLKATTGRACYLAGALKLRWVDEVPNKSKECP